MGSRFLVLAGFVLIGCASLSDRPFSVPESGGNSAKVVVFGAIVSNNSQDPFLFVDGSKVGRMHPEGFRILELAPGKHIVEAKQSSLGLPDSKLRGPFLTRDEIRSGYSYHLTGRPRVEVTLGAGDVKYVQIWSRRVGAGRRAAFNSKARYYEFGGSVLEPEQALPTLRKLTELE